jgi:aspartate/methionine/tyrosine aminotransferase
LVSERIANIHESTTLKISAMAKKLNKSGLDVIDLGVGEPDFATPQNICEAGCNSIRNGETHYAPTSGIAELRQAIAEKLCDENKLAVTADDVVVTPGAKMAVFATVQALMQEGDECVLIGPSWVSYEPCVAFSGGHVVWGQVDEDFMPVDLAETITRKTKLILMNSPCNPTGAVFDRKILKEISDLAVDHDLFVVSDEIYEKIIYDRAHKHRIASGHGGSNSDHQWIFQVLRHDWLASRLFNRPQGDSEVGNQAVIPFRLAGHNLRAKGRGRGLERTSGCRQGHEGRVLRQKRSLCLWSAEDGDYL